jgi:hypothetical protein
MLDRGEASKEYQRQAGARSRRGGKTTFAANCMISSIAVPLLNGQLSPALEMLTDVFVSKFRMPGYGVSHIVTLDASQLTISLTRTVIVACMRCALAGTG